MAWGEPLFISGSRHQPPKLQTEDEEPGDGEGRPLQTVDPLGVAMRDEEHEEGECAVSVMEPRFAPSYNKQHNSEDGLGHERSLPDPENPPKPGPGMSIADPRHEPPQSDNDKDDGDRRPEVKMDHSHGGECLRFWQFRLATT